MKKVKRMLAWVVALILVLSPVGINPIYVKAEDPVTSFEVSISYDGTPPTRYGVEWEFIGSDGDKISGGHTDDSSHARETVAVPTGTELVLLRVYHSTGKEVWLGESLACDYDDWVEISVSDLASSYEFTLKDDSFWNGFPTDFGSTKLEVGAKNRVDMDNMHNNEIWGPNFHASGEFPTEKLSGMTLNKFFTDYNGVDFKAKIVEAYSDCAVDEIIYGFGVELSDGSKAKVAFSQGYLSPIALSAGNTVTFNLDMRVCYEYNSIIIEAPDGKTYNDIKNLPITSITADFNLNKKGTVSYVDPTKTGFTIDTTKPYLNIVIPEMEIEGSYDTWGSWANIKALYSVSENKATKFDTYEELLTNYRGIKIKVDVSDINPSFDKDNEVFFYLHDPFDDQRPEAISNGVKYDITDGHNEGKRQYIRKGGGIQEFTFDFAGTYYMEGTAPPDIWLSMGVKSRPEKVEDELGDVHYCDIKPVIENASGTISLGSGCEKMRFADPDDTGNDGWMNVEKATKISLNVSEKSDVLSALEGEDTPSDTKQANLKSLIEANENLGTDDSATEQVKQVMEINLTVDDTEVQPKNNKVKVSIPLTQFGDVDPSKMKLYHHVDGRLEEITGIEVKNGMVSFDTPSFSYFVVVEDSSIPDKPDDGEEDKTSTDTSSSTTVDTKANTTQDSNVAINTSNAGGYGRELASSMLINDINAATPGTTLVIDRRYNRQYLSNAEMRTLLSKQNVTLCMQYNYNGVEYITTIPAGTAIDDAIPYYGPLYLAALYSETCTVIAANGGVVNTSNAGGFGRELTSSMLISDIEAAIPGTTLVIDRRYNRQYLTNAEMMALVNKQTVSLRMQYNYNGVEYDILIPAGVGVNNILAYYGPLYLAAYYR